MSGRPGSLIVVGTGIEAIGQITLAAQRAIEGADEVLYLVPDPLTQAYIERLNPASESLRDLYESGKDRAYIYAAMTRRILREVRRGRRVCAAFYGHPGFVVRATHSAMRTARAESHRVRMLAAVSAEDCLFADLGIDPGEWGCQTYEATNFLMRRRLVDTSTPLVLWQIGVIGIFDYGHDPDKAASGLVVLADVLANLYGDDHEVVVYEAALLGICDARLEYVRVRDLPTVEPTSASTLYVPPSAASEWDTEMIARLGIDLEGGRKAEAAARSLYDRSSQAPESGTETSRTGRTAQ
jgi:uncharacterized protein YabN with tetrapyrrole methylase and pyrophosphatase domain